jgi:hypothetical protein
MATKSGRIKLEDLRQGKTIWKPAIGRNGWVPKAFFVEVGVQNRVVGLRADEQGCMRTYTLPMYSLAHYGDRRVFSTFHPSRNSAVKPTSDGSMMQIDAFTTRNACARFCANMGQGSYTVLNDLNLSVYDEYLGHLSSIANPHYVTRAQMGIPEAY